MMKLLKGVLTLAIVFAFAATFADADGKKANGKICIRNYSQEYQMAVIVDPTKQTYQSEQEFLADGGKILNPGEKATFDKIKAGDHLIAAALVERFEGSAHATYDVRIEKHQTRCFCLWDYTQRGCDTDNCTPQQQYVIIEEEDCNKDKQTPR